jgi:hypothetical protein
LGSDSAEEGEKALERTTAAKAASTAPAKPRAAAAAASAVGSVKAAASQKITPSKADLSATNDDPPEFEISAAPAEWSVDDESQAKTKR